MAFHVGLHFRKAIQFYSIIFHGIAKCIQNPTCGPCPKCCALGLGYTIQFYAGITFLEQKKSKVGFVTPMGYCI
jgi:hypothetical protein